MPFQSTVTQEDLAYGVVGEFAFASPQRVKTFSLNSASAAYNVAGRAFTVKSEGIAEAGGTGVFAGILVNPKGLETTGLPDTNDAITYANGDVAELCIMGEVFVTLAGAAAIGDAVTYNTTTGVLGTVAPVAAFTAAQSTTTLTVSAITAGNLGVGSVVRQASGSLSTIIALGTGTGGTGTYTLDTSQTVSSGAATATSTAPSGSAFVPNTVVSQFTVAGAGLAVVKLTN